MDSDLITELAVECPNLAGVKLTYVHENRYILLLKLIICRCGDVGKLSRITATVSDQTFSANYPRKNKNAPFLVLGGFTDILLPSVYANGHGAITGLANIAPVSR